MGFYALILFGLPGLWLLAYLAMIGKLRRFSVGRTGMNASFVTELNKPVSDEARGLEITPDDIRKAEMASAPRNGLEGGLDDPVVFSLRLNKPRGYERHEILSNCEELRRQRPVKNVMFVDERDRRFFAHMTVDDFERLLSDGETAERFISALNAGHGQQLLEFEGVSQAAVLNTASLAEALAILTSHDFKSAPVIDKNSKFQGIVDLGQIVGRLQEALHD